jgi:A/G-specific adenine glycosylase
MIVELFLKKTKAETVNNFIREFIMRYNCIKKIMTESEKKILRQISPLGLGNQRLKALKELSAYINDNFNDKLPDDITQIMKIPYVGLYTANATLCFGFNKRNPILDVNTSRIISRFFSLDNTKDLRDNKILQDKARKLLPRKNFKEYNWGLLDLGALICKSQPLCKKCPLRKKCDHCFSNNNFD